MCSLACMSHNIREHISCLIPVVKQQESISPGTCTLACISTITCDHEAFLLETVMLLRNNPTLHVLLPLLTLLVKPLLRTIV